MKQQANHEKIKAWVARVLIGLVLLDNFQAAILFLVIPTRIAPDFGLSGVAGQATIQGIGLLFLMWCVPYFIATLDPMRHKVSLIECLIMEGIALVGETVLLALLPEHISTLVSSVERFIFFDGIGVILLVLAAAIVWIPRRKRATS